MTIFFSSTTEALKYLPIKKIFRCIVKIKKNKIKNNKTDKKGRKNKTDYTL